MKFLLSPKNILQSTSFRSHPLPSTSLSPSLPPLLSIPTLKQTRSMTTAQSRYLKISPSTRTKLTNTFFVLACSLSILTVSLGMSGVGGRSLPCPARRNGDGRGEVGLEAEEEAVRFERRLRKGKGREVVEGNSTVLEASKVGGVVATTSGGWKEKSSSKRQWLEDPKPRITTNNNNNHNKNSSNSSWNFNLFNSASVPTSTSNTSASRKNEA